MLRYCIYLLVKLGSEQIIYFQVIIGFHLKHACICVVQKMALYFSFPYTILTPSVYNVTLLIRYKFFFLKTRQPGVVQVFHAHFKAQWRRSTVQLACLAYSKERRLQHACILPHLVVHGNSQDAMFLQQFRCLKTVWAPIKQGFDVKPSSHNIQPSSCSCAILDS